MRKFSLKSVLNNKVYTVNLIGCGRIGYSFEKFKSNTPLSHFSAILSNPSFKLTAVCDMNQAILDEISSTNKNISTYSNNEEMLIENQPDIVVIASPDSTHMKMILDSINVSPEVIFVEKPLLSTIKEYNDIKSALDNNPSRLIVNFSRRFNPKYEEILSNQDITKIIIKFSGTLIHNGIHFIDLILKRFGNPIEIIKSDSGLISFSYKNGLNVYFINMSEVKVSVEEIEIYLSDKRYLITNEKQIIQKKIQDPNFNGFYIFGDDQDIKFKFQDELKNAYNKILEILGQGKEYKNELIHNKKLLEVILKNEK